MGKTLPHLPPLSVESSRIMVASLLYLELPPPFRVVQKVIIEI